MSTALIIGLIACAVGILAWKLFRRPPSNGSGGCGTGCGCGTT